MNESYIQSGKKKKYNNEWKATKVYVLPNVLAFSGWEDLLKFDATAWTVIVEVIYCASSKVKS